MFKFKYSQEDIKIVVDKVNNGIDLLPLDRKIVREYSISLIEKYLPKVPSEIFLGSLGMQVYDELCEYFHEIGGINRYCPPKVLDRLFVRESQIKKVINHHWGEHSFEYIKFSCSKKSRYQEFKNKPEWAK